MVTATLPAAAEVVDRSGGPYVFVIIEKQYPRFPAPGVYQWTIGMAYEGIKSGRMKIDPRSAKEYAEFEKSANAPRKLNKLAQEILTKEETESRARAAREGVKRSAVDGGLWPHEVRKNMI